MTATPHPRSATQLAQVAGRIRPSTPVVSTIAVRALVAGVEDAGVERARLLAHAGLTAFPLDDPDAELPHADYVRLLRAALATSGDPALGLRMGQRASPGRFDVLVYMTEHSSCLREALGAFLRYGRIVARGPRLELHELGDLASIRCTVTPTSVPELQLTAEFAMTFLLRLVRHFVGASARPRRVCFPYARPAHGDEYARAFDGRAHFEQPFTELQIDRAWLDRANAFRSPELWALFRSRVELLLARSEHEVPARERVQAALAAQNLESRPTMETIGRQLGMSARSLRRRLHDERAPFHDLVEQARAEHAKRLLTDARASVQDAAYALGFNTPAAFSRAFKRWTGMAPTTFRATR